jgi:hypothetical protein
MLHSVNHDGLDADDKFRDRFLWGRRPMLAAVAARLPKATDNVWVDLGGGTGVSLSSHETLRFESSILCRSRLKSSSCRRTC